jgi:hypothetical protein
MARTLSFSPAQKTIPTNATTVAVWTPAEIDSAGLVMLHLVLQQTGGTFDLNDVQSVRVKANGQTVVDLTTAQLQSYQERFSPKGASDLITGRVLTIPLNRLGAAGGMDDEDRCQFMPGATCTVEVVFVTDAAAGAGIAFLGWTKTTVEPEFWLNIIQQPMNVNGAQNNARVPLGAQGIVEGLGIVTANVRQVRAILSGIEVMNVAGGSYNGLANLGDMLRASQSLYDAPDDASDIATFQWLQLNQGLQANPATSWLEVTSSAGMAPTDSVAILSIVPVAGA